MFESIFIGSGFAFAAALQPGPLQAFLLASVSRTGWRRTLPASFSPLLSDGPIAFLVLAVLSRVPGTVRCLLQAAGGIFLLYLAWSGYRQWRGKIEIGSKTHGPAPRTLVQAAVVNILNPNPYIGWSLVLGPAVLAAWHRSPQDAAALVLAFYATMVLVLACLILLFGLTRFLGPGGRRALVLVSAGLLAGIGIYQLAAGLFKATSTG